MFEEEQLIDTPACGSGDSDLDQCLAKLCLFPQPHADSLLERLKHLSICLSSAGVDREERANHAHFLLDMLTGIISQAQKAFLTPRQVRPDGS